MPGFHPGMSDYTTSRSFPSNRRSSRFVDEALDPFILTLHSITELCNDIIDMPLSVLTSSPNTCTELVEKVQKIGHVWDEHPDWHGRAWYVQLLLTVAGLSRVVEWWEAEKQFWHFDDDDTAGTPGEDEKVEPLNFVLKPAEVDESFLPSGSSTIPTATPGSSSDGRRSRDEHQKQLQVNEVDKNAERVPGSSTMPSSDLAPSPMLDDGEKLQEEVERAQNMYIVMELALDGDHLIWVNDAWRTVVG
jgi:serine/threonine-protein kinase RIM15